MGDLLKDGLGWLEDQRAIHLAHEVAYSRDGNSVTLDATVGRTQFEQQDEFGRVIRYQSRDYLIAAEDLILGGNQVEPAEGDGIRETIGGQTHVYRVMSPGDEPPFRWSDPYRKTFRIHTKLVATE